MSAIHMVDQAALDRWAELSRDHNPIHVDPAFAAGTRFGGTIAHGHLTVAWLMQAAQSEWGTDAWAAAGVLSSLRYRRPVRPGVEYRVVAEAEPDRGLELGVVAPDGDVVVRAVAGLVRGAHR